MKLENSSVKLTYKEFCAFMKRYEKENQKKESNHRINKLAYKPVFKKKKDNE
jgi:hypothetical protein